MHKLKIGSLLLLLLFISCKTIPTAKRIEPIDLLTSDNNVLFSLSATQNQEVVNKLLLNSAQGISETDVSKLTKKLKTIYCGLNLNTNKIQIIAYTNISNKYLPSILTEKNGWITEDLQFEDSPFIYKVYKNNQIELTTYDNNVICAGNDVKNMLYNYDLKFLTFNFDDRNLDSDIYEWIEKPGDTIKFYTNNSKSFLSMITNNLLDLDLMDHMKGELVASSEDKDFFQMKLIISFKNEKFRKAGKSIISIALKPLNVDIELSGDSDLIVKNLKINKEQIYNSIKL